MYRLRANIHTVDVFGLRLRIDDLGLLDKLALAYIVLCIGQQEGNKDKNDNENVMIGESNGPHENKDGHDWQQIKASQMNQTQVNFTIYSSAEQLRSGGGCSEQGYGIS